jgi:hypothetical protein
VPHPPTAGTQHRSLTLERWQAFSSDQRLLMIANELRRAGKLVDAGDDERRANAYERVLALTDLTIQAASRRGLRRELLRWRDLVAELWLRRRPDAQAHDAIWTSLLRFSAETSRQLRV